MKYAILDVFKLFSIKNLFEVKYNATPRYPQRAYDWNKKQIYSHNYKDKGRPSENTTCLILLATSRKLNNIRQLNKRYFGSTRRQHVLQNDWLDIQLKYLTYIAYLHTFTKKIHKLNAQQLKSNSAAKQLHVPMRDVTADI